MIIRSEDLLNVFKAVYIPRWELIFTLLLFLVSLMFYTYYAYLYIFPDYDGWCDSTYVCLIATTDWLLKEPEGGVGTRLTGNGHSISKNAYGEGQSNYSRLLLFDLTADIFIVIMILQIFSGIIIDKFTSEREKLESMNDDQDQKCFICGIFNE